MSVKVSQAEVKFPCQELAMILSSSLERSEIKNIMQKNYKNLIKILSQRNDTIASQFKPGATVPMIVGHNHVTEIVQELEKKNISTFVLAAHHANELTASLI